MKSKTVTTAIIVSAGLLLLAGIVVLLFYTTDETIHFHGIPRDWSCLSGDVRQWSWTDNAIYGHSTNGDSILASAKEYGDVMLSAMVSTTNREASLAFRMQGPNDGYLVIFGPDGTATASWNGGHIWLIKREAGQEQQLAMFDRGGLSAPGQPEKLAVIAKGPRLEVRLNDVTIMKTNDSTFDSGYIGLRIYGDSKYSCDGVFSNLTVRARWADLRGEGETWSQEKIDDASQSVAVANPETSTNLDQSSTSTPPASTATSIPIPLSAPSVGSDYTVAASNSAPATNHAATFGPVMERTLGIDNNECDFLVFRTGEVLRHTYIDGDASGLTPPTDFMKWARGNGVDIGFCASTNAFYSSPGLLALDMGTFQFESNTIPSGLLPRSLSVEKWRASIGSSADVWNNLMAEQLHGPTNDVPAFFLRDKVFAEWFARTNLHGPLAFSTRDGLEGIMQITGFTNNPPRLKIRYKLVESEPME
jgi:hypothetical protein